MEISVITFIIDLLANHPEAKELTMSPKQTTDEAKAHIPRLVLSQHVHKEIHGDSWVGRINTRVALGLTRLVGSMWCAYLFALLALISLPAAIISHDPIIIVAWIAQTFLQLVLLPIIIVGQNVQAAASDARAESDHETLLSIHTLTSEVHEISNQQTAILKILEERSNR
jgi:hypothetical protein